MNSIQDEKSLMRMHYKQLRKDFCQDRKQDLCRQLSQNLQAFFQDRPDIKTCGTYKALPSEADPEFFCQSYSIQWAYPKLEDEQMQFYLPLSESEFALSPLGIAEPIVEKSKFIDKNKLDALLIPACAVDRRGNRLGMGKAFYDRYLNGFSNLRIGIVWSVQVAENIPVEESDESLDLIITENEIIQVERES